MLKRNFLLAALLALLLPLAACAGSDVENEGENAGNTTENSLPAGCQDLDLDGFAGRTGECPDGPDCDDNERTINPSAVEICGDRKDNNCDGTIDEECDRDCIDEDDDGYGEGSACLGPDCNDSDRSIRPRAEEICGNEVDEDCDGADKACPTNCIDEDDDGFGAEGSTDCDTDQVDCDDTNAAINPGATEVCNEVDDNCNDTVDECPGTGQACAGASCLGGPGAECANNDQCAGSLVCDASQDPKLCKQTEGGNCSTADDCVSGLACENSQCTGDFCAVNTCDEPGLEFCYREAGACVECPIFDPDITAQDAPCPGAEQCTPGGWCALNEQLQNSSPVGNTTSDILTLSILMVECWQEKRAVGDKDMCFSLFVSNQVTQTLTESIMASAYTEGDLATSLTAGQDAALDDLWGVGLFDAREVDWKEDVVPGTAKEVCLWYEPGNLIGVEGLVVDRCENYSP